MDDICKYCIDILMWWTKNSSFSYGEINVWLFIIIQPLLISIFIATTVFNCYSKNEMIKKEGKGYVFNRDFHYIPLIDR